MTGKVDDLELTQLEDAPPFLSALITGPGALSPRTAGRLGRWLRSYRARTEGRDLPGQIGIELVVSIRPQVQITASREELAGMRSERWVREHVLGHIPGGSRATE